MKTVTDIQMELRDISGRIDTLSTELSEIVRQESHGDTAWEIDFEQLQARGKRYPLYGHMLSGENDFTKKRYLSMLISILMLLPDNKEHGWLIVQRIASGVHLKTELSELAANAATLTPKILDEFTLEIINNKLKYEFILDLMVIYLSCNGNSNCALQYIAALTEFLGYKHWEVRELLLVAKLIMHQDLHTFETRPLRPFSLGMQILGSCYFGKEATAVRLADTDIWNMLKI